MVLTVNLPRASPSTRVGIAWCCSPYTRLERDPELAMRPLHTWSRKTALQAVQLGTCEVAAIDNHAMNPLRIPDVIEWISVEQDKVTPLARRHRSSCFQKPKESGRIHCRRPKRLKRTQPSTD